MYDKVPSHRKVNEYLLDKSTIEREEKARSLVRDRPIRAITIVVSGSHLSDEACFFAFCFLWKEKERDES